MILSMRQISIDLTLVRKLVDLARQHLTVKVSGYSLLEYLSECDLVHAIELTGSDGNILPSRFYLIGLNETGNVLHPVELLQAILPQGVMCYFMAIEFHKLSTQIPSHYNASNLRQHFKSQAAETDWANFSFALMTPPTTQQTEIDLEFRERRSTTFPKKPSFCYYTGTNIT